MLRYIALLRGINVGGNKVIKMEELRRVFESLRLKNVKTYIQSGNVVFDAAETDVGAMARKIEKRLEKSLGHQVTVILLTMAEIEDIVRRNPFKRVEAGDDVAFFVTFLPEEQSGKPKLPLISTTENLEVFALNNRAAFILARRKKNGSFGFPNNFVEKQFGTPATTRNWTTVRKIVDFAQKS